MKTFKIRCSAIGQIMTNGRNKDELRQPCKSYLDQWMKEQLYSRTKEFSNKYTEKGIEVEQMGLDLIAEQLGYGILFKNEKRYGNSYMSGTPDSVLNDHIIDVKSSWNCFTFPLFETEIKEQDYYWQGQGYMELANIDKYKLIYVLLDTPVELIYKEANSFCYKTGNELNDKILDEFTAKMTYGKIPNNLKIKVFEFERNKEDIAKIEQRVMQCRQYIESVTSKYNI